MHISSGLRDLPSYRIGKQQTTLWSSAPFSLGKLWKFRPVLPNTNAADYTKIKTALLKNYNLTEEGFRVKFRHNKPKNSESPEQYLTRIETYYESWLATAEVKTYDDMKNLILREQFLNMCPRNLEIHLRERSFTSISKMCKQADRYLEARNQKMTTGIRAKPDDNIQDTDTKLEQKQQKNCYNCGKLGHTHAECQNEGGGNEQKCNHCGIYGHTEEACWNKKEFTGMMSTRSIQNRHHAKLRMSNQNKGTQRSKNQVDLNKTLKLVPGKVYGGHFERHRVFHNMCEQEACGT